MNEKQRRAKAILDISKMVNLHFSGVNRYIRINKINVYQLHSIFTDPQAELRRDEFYSLFINIDQADLMWERFMDNYYLPKYY